MIQPVTVEQSTLLVRILSLRTDRAPSNGLHLGRQAVCRLSTGAKTKPKPQMTFNPLPLRAKVDDSPLPSART